jgi:hypothetical protein
MRIVKGGMVLRSIGPNQYTVKDEPAVGVQINQIPLRLTKDALYQVLTLNNIPFNRNDKKRSLEAQLYQLYALHPTQNSRHIIYEKGKARLKPKVKSEIPELAFKERTMPKPRVRKPKIEIPKPKVRKVRQIRMRGSVTLDTPPPKPPRPLKIPPPLPPRPNKILNLDEPPPKPPRPFMPPPKPPRPFMPPPKPPRAGIKI